MLSIHNLNKNKAMFYDKGALASTDIYHNPLTEIELCSPHHPSILYNNILGLLPLKTEYFKTINFKEGRAKII